MLSSPRGAKNDNFAIRVFSTRAAEQQAVSLHSEKVINDVTCTCVEIFAQDEESSTRSSI